VQEPANTTIGLHAFHVTRAGAGKSFHVTRGAGAGKSKASLFLLLPAILSEMTNMLF